MLFIVLFVLIRILSNSLLGVYQKKLAEKGYSSNYINFISYLILTIIIFIAYIILKRDFNYDAINDIILYTLLTGLTGAIGNAFQIKALKVGELSILAPINSYKILFSLVFSFFLLKEIPSLSAFIGIMLIIFGSYFIFDTTEEGFNLSLFKRRDIQFRILAVLFTSLEAIFIKKIILLTDTFCTLLLWTGATALFSLFFIVNRDVFKKIDFKSWKLFIYMVFSLGLMQLSTNYLFKMINVSYALSLFQLSSILSVILGWRVFHEKDVIKKLIGSLIMVIGASFIIILT